MNPSHTTESDSQSPPAAEPLRVGVYGVLTTRLRYGALVSPLPASSLAVIIDSDVRLARSWARQMGAKPEFMPSFGDFLAQPPAVDAMILPIPLRLRQSTIKACLENRIGVLCELPFAYSLKEQEELIRLAQEQETLLMPMLPRRFDPAFEAVTKILAEGSLGDLRHVRGEWSLPMGEVAIMENGVDDIEEDLLLQHILCQSVDRFQGWFGEPMTVSGDVVAFRKENISAKRQKPEEAPLGTLLISFDRAQVTLSASRTRSAYPGERYLFTGTQAQLEFIARSGTRHATSTAPTITIHKAGRVEVVEIFEESTPERRVAEALSHFLACARGLVPAPTFAQEMHSTLNVVHGGYLSTVGNNKISLPLKRAPSFEAFFRRFETTKHIGL